MQWNERGDHLLLGIKTLGNATILVYDEAPLLATDPWLGEPEGACLGSWGLLYPIPESEQREILAAPWVWFSHGHSDHLNAASLPHFRARKILLPDHVGGRIARDLRELGYDVRVLPHGEWVPLSKLVKILCLGDAAQDAVLLIDIGGRLIVNVNDGFARGLRPLLRRLIEPYPASYLVKAAGLGVGDMINFFDEEGRRALPVHVDPDRLAGRDLSATARRFGVTHAMPFSFYHCYQRSDSAWANDYVADVAIASRGFDSRFAELVPPYGFLDCTSGENTSLGIARTEPTIRPPEAFGDSWSDPLESGEWLEVAEYFQRKEMLHDHFGFIRVRAGGVERSVDLRGPRDRGISFEVPRASLLASVRHETFDELLMGNFMRTTLHGVESLYRPDFSNTVGKVADNGRAQTREEVLRYRRAYDERIGPDLARAQMVERITGALHGVLARHASRSLYLGARNLHRRIRRW